MADEAGTEIIVANNPALFKLNATPEQHFFRRIAFAVTEYERDCLVERLQSGLRAAAAKRGGVAAQGRKIILQKSQAHEAAEEGPEEVDCPAAAGGLRLPATGRKDELRAEDERVHVDGDTQAVVRKPWVRIQCTICNNATACCIISPPPSLPMS